MKVRSKKKKYYKELDLIRVIACIAILLYHLNILKGGYLAVCVFFVLSGYLSCLSAFKDKKFSLKEYYKKRLLKLYLPLLVVVFITIAVLSFFPNIEFLNIKPETRSIILGYNNFWQISANLDYFAHHVSSPFMHLWYIAILLQFDLVFPFIFLILRKIENKFNKIIPCVITLDASILFAIYFFIMALSSNMMVTYYNTATRVFSLLSGMFLGLIHANFKPFISKKMSKKKEIFYTLIGILVFLFIFIDSKNILFSLSMILVTFITVVLIDFIANLKSKKLNKFDQAIKYLASMSYEIYLVQYPVIFIFQSFNLPAFFKIPIIIILTLLIAWFLNIVLNKKETDHQLLKYFMQGLILVVTFFGIYKYATSLDYAKEMKKLEAELSHNQEVMNQKQKEHESKIIEEEENWQASLKDLEDGEKEIKKKVRNLSIVGIGDSIMLGAVDKLYSTFPNGYFDAEVSRTAWKANSILLNLKERNMLGNPIVFNLGINGVCSDDCHKDIMQTIGNREVFVVNISNNKYDKANTSLESFARRYSNVHIIDWKKASTNHPEYFFADKIHLTPLGQKAYAETIYNAIYQKYLDEYTAKKNATINAHNEEMKNKITFYGNDILLYAFDNIKNNFEDSKFNIDANYNYETIKNKIESEITNDTLTNKIVFVFDSSLKLSKDDYSNLINLCNNKTIYIVSTDKETTENLQSINNDNVKVIDFSKTIQDNNYLSIDKIHLTEEGNIALSNILKEQVK